MPLDPTDDVARVLALKQIRANIITEITVEQNARLTAGVTKATYSLGGRSVSWGDWYKAMLAEVRALDEQIVGLEQYEYRMKGWT